jgi:hypothetical protein
VRKVRLTKSPIFVEREYALVETVFTTAHTLNLAHIITSYLFQVHFNNVLECATSVLPLAVNQPEFCMRATSSTYLILIFLITVKISDEEFKL